MKRLAVVTIALLAAACSGPMSQSTNPATVQSAVAPDRMTPNACGFVKMEQTQNRVKPLQRIGIWAYLRWPNSGVCESLKIPATWTASGGRLFVTKKGYTARFSAVDPGTYYVSATVNYNNNSYTGQATITVK